VIEISHFSDFIQFN